MLQCKGSAFAAVSGRTLGNIFIMTDIKFYNAPWKSLKLIAASSLFVILGIWILTKANNGVFDKIMGWIGIIFFSLGIIVGLFQLLDRRPQIIINEIGIWDRSLKLDLIKWESIQNAYKITIFKQIFISLKIDKDYQIKVRQYKWALSLQKAVGAQKFNLKLSGLRINQNKLLDFIKAMIKADIEQKRELINTLPNK